jgi:hypothetical protein
MTLKRFKDYLKKRLSEKEIFQIEQDAKREAKKFRKKQKQKKEGTNEKTKQL